MGKLHIFDLLEKPPPTIASTSKFSRGGHESRCNAMPTLRTPSTKMNSYIPLNCRPLSSKMSCCPPVEGN